MSAKTIGRLLTVAAKTKAKVGPHLPRGSTVLSGVKVAATVAGKVGSSVPYMQGIVDAANEVVACTEVRVNPVHILLALLILFRSGDEG